MNAKIKFIGVFLFSLLSLLPQLAYAQQYLQTDGTTIIDADGEEVIFRGIGLGGWMLQEGYMLGTGGPQHELEARIEALVGEAQKDAFYDAWLANHTRKIDIDSLAAWGFNLIRLPMHYKWFTPPIEEEPVPGEITWLDRGFEMTDQLLSWCEENNMYLILDLHAAPGGQGENADISDYDPSKPSLWESVANRAKMIALWRQLAERYANEPMIAGYDIINEPNWGFQNHASDPNGCAETQNTPLWNLQKDITSAIREVDQNHIIIIEGNCWGNNYNGLPVLWDDNLVISYHKYWNANDQGAIQGMLNMRNNRQVPIWLGETGENSNTWFTNAISLFEGNDFGWSWWPLKKLGYNNPLQIPRNPGYEAILNHWNNNGPAPSSEAAFAGLMQFAEDLKLENNIYHPSVVDAMIRQPHSEEAIPFKPHTVQAGTTTVIYTPDFDMGRHGIAYGDAEVENTTGNAGGQAWNLGYSYRNDGVDIEACEDSQSNGYNVGWTEDGEWLQYTIWVEEAGSYELALRTAATGSSSVVQLTVNGLAVTTDIPLPNTGGYQEWETTNVGIVPLESGTNIVRLNIETGGTNLNYFSFTGPVDISGEQPVLLEATGTHGEQQIDLVFNHSFQSIPAGATFELTYNGEPITVTEAYLKDGIPRVITLEVASPLSYGDEVLVDYLGTGITTINGTPLNPFMDEEVAITLAGGIVPITIPGRVEAEDFTVNSGFEFEETTDTGGGVNAAYTDFGDYLDYWVYVEQMGTYQVAFRVASESVGGNIALQLVEDGAANTLTTVQFGATGGWQTWTTVAKEINLEKGVQALRLLAQGQLFNVNWMNFAFIGGPSSTLTPTITDDWLQVYPNPNVDSLLLVFRDKKVVPEQLEIYNTKGQQLMVVPVSMGALEVSIPHQLPSGQYVISYQVQGISVSRKFVVR